MTNPEEFLQHAAEADAKAAASRDPLLENDFRTRRGRPRTDATPVMVRLAPDQLAFTAAWRDRQDDKPSRPEAVRRLLTLAAQDRRQAPR